MFDSLPLWGRMRLRDVVFELRRSGTRTRPSGRGLVRNYSARSLLEGLSSLLWKHLGDMGCIALFSTLSSIPPWSVVSIQSTIYHE
ncbi:hypothetical protein BJX66DRAFT_303608 [Aspergillus keveii]|uniref:Uncharacterized protein n=1 Tax=Aspergillus keveii TaxID=714993 RepID=A0ABR4G652_9EURO